LERLLILTGARLREVLDAQWRHVDFERGVIFLPDSKTGKKPIYLSAAALAILTPLPRLEGNPFVIPGEKSGQPRADLKRPWAAVTKAAGLDGVRIHDLRHSFASVGAGSSLGLPIIGKLLGHRQAATTQSRPFGCGPDAASSRDDRRNDRRGNGGHGREGERRSHERGS
jgi:integrase